MQSKRRIIIVGGGISGLVAALEVQRLVKDQGESVRVDLFEAATRLGGKIFSEKVGAFLVEAGPDTFLVSKPAGIELCRQLGLDDEIIPTRSDTRQSFVSCGGVLHPLPEGMSGLVPRGVKGVLGSALLSSRGKVRACLERFIRSRANGRDESVFAFASRRFGNEIAERIVEPLLSGIYAGDGRRLSAAAAIPQLWSMEKEFGSVSRGLKSRSRSSTAEPSTPFASLTAGMGSLIERLQARLGNVSIHTSTPVQAVRKRGGKYQVDVGGDTVVADAVVLATPSFHSANLLRGWLPALSNELETIRFVSTVTVSMGYAPGSTAMPQHGYGYIVPRAEGREVTACSWTTLKLPHRSPDDSFLLRVFIGRDGEETATTRPDGELISIAKREVEQSLRVTDAPVMVRVSKHPRAMPQYELGHLDRLARVDELLSAEPGLSVAGCSYRGVGIPDCIQSGRRAALQAVQSLGLAALQ